MKKKETLYLAVSGLVGCYSALSFLLDDTDLFKGLRSLQCRIRS